MRIPFIAGNWKMNKTMAEARLFARDIKEMYLDTDVRAAIFAPYTQLLVLKEALKNTGIALGAQNVHYEMSGAYTGEISIPMLSELGVDYCLIGHSERRQYFGETDQTVNLKMKALLDSEIKPLVCVGEDLGQREAGQALTLVEKQVRAAFDGIAAEKAVRATIAYEPIWAIGTGRTATPEQANEMCACIRSVLSSLYDEETADEIIIQYGGSVTPENATQIMNMEEIDGALVGGASLDPVKFMQIVDF